VKWNPSWKKSLAVDGLYGPVTHHALEVFKKTCGYGKDGSSVDGRSAGALNALAKGVGATPGVEDSDLTVKGWIGQANELQKTSAPTFPGIERDEDFPTTSAALRIKKAAGTNPSSYVTYQNHRMQAHTAFNFIKLEQQIGRRFPGTQALITSTMDGRHMSGAHYEGRAIDFVLLGTHGELLNLSTQKALALEQVCRDSGFSTYNEYLKDSPYKTGPHMHISRKDTSVAAAGR
jgi:hypothetical protein